MKRIGFVTRTDGSGGPRLLPPRWRPVSLFGRRALLAAGAVLVVALSGFAQPAWGTELVLPPGEVAKVTQVKFGACSSLTYGYQLDEGPETNSRRFPGDAAKP